MMGAIVRPVEGLRALVLGAGGTARAATWALQHDGADVSVFNRTTERAAKLADDLGVAVVLDVAGGEGFELIVNTTAVGMDEKISEEEALSALGLDLGVVSRSAVVVDFVYRRGGSPLTSAARAAGLTVIDGNELLARQGALSFETWFERPAPLDVMRAAIA
jgi:shikimate 5-dehydrogenase